MEKHHPSSETRLLTTPRGPPPPRRIVTPLASTILAVLLFLGYSSLGLPPPHPPPPSPQSKHQSLVDTVQKCAIDKLHEDLSFLDGAAPIAADEFLARRDRLAQALVASTPAVDAFVLEPGYAFQYYANTSQADWEPWEPEERPFLMLVLPEVYDGQVRARAAFLAPHFEEGRVRMLGIPSREASAELDIVVWEEHWDPYATLRASPLFADFDSFGQRKKPRLMVDDEMRDFIVRGLGTAGFDTVGLGAAAEAVRQAKTPAEVALLRAVNTGTVAAVRTMRPCLAPGLTEDDVTAVLDSALLSVGFRLFFDIVLFEENGALPHGGFVTGSKVLTHESMVVIDVGAHYLGYSSDICRSFFIDPPTTSPSGDANGGVLAGLLRKVLGWWTGETATTTIAQWQPSDPALHAEKMRVWQIVLDAQTAAAQAFKPNASAASVDIAARTVIEDAGYGDAFTHRVGHGIGIKGVFLNGGGG